MQNQLFIDKLKELEFRKKGYTILNISDLSVLDEIANIYTLLVKPKLNRGTDFYYSLSNNLEFNLKLKEKIATTLRPIYNTWFTNFDHLAESFLIKRSGDTKELELHQDWNFVNEAHHISVTLWCPFFKIDPNNGGFFLIDGSHKFFNNIRSDSYQTSRIASTEALKKITTTIQLKRGQVLAFHPAIFHGSFPNNTNNERPIASTLIKSKSAPLLHYVKKDNLKAEVFEIEEQTLLSELVNLSNSVPPKNFVSKQCFKYEHKSIDSQILIAKYGS